MNPTPTEEETVANDAIPEHDGRTPDALRNNFSGNDDATGEVLHVGDEVVMLVKGKVNGIAHKENQFGVLRRIQSIAVDHSIVADESTRQRVEAEVKRREDEAAGQESFDNVSAFPGEE